MNKNRGKKTVNWEQLKAEYMADSSLSYQSLATKYKISQQAVALHGKKEDWVKIRKQLAEETVKDVMSEKKEAIKEANTRHAAGAKKIQAFCLEAIEKMGGSQLIYHQEAAAYIRSYKQAADLERAVLGISTVVTKIADEEGDEPVIFDIMGTVANAGDQD